MNKLKKLLNLYKQFLLVLEKEGDDQVHYAINIIHDDLEQLEGFIKLNVDEKINIELFNKIKENYESLYPPRGGLTEFFIWREDFDERFTENEKLNNLKKEIDDIFSS